tara:strand:- start:1986 stop:2198 length:213 start_codon:yes stop_codon:yes gene_type:complete
MKQPTMKAYTATFLNTWSERYVLYADGISDTHANARAWIKFMKTQFYKDAPDSWELEELVIMPEFQFSAR